MAMNKFIQMNTIFNGASEKRLKEVDFCLKKNLKNPLIKGIIIFLEIQQDEKESPIVKSWHDIPGITINRITKRPTYSDFFEYANRFEGKWILSNADIYFPLWNSEELEKLYHSNFKNTFYVLTRYNVFEDFSDEQKEVFGGISLVHDGINYETMWDDGSSVDSWIFKTPLRTQEVDFDIELGAYYCDTVMNTRLLESSMLKIIAFL